jgi:hypothetical protein
MLCLGNPFSSPSILEALDNKCIILAPSHQISFDLHNNPNIILTDNMNINDISG